MRLKVFYIVSDISKALAFEWIVTSLDKNRFDLRFIVIGEKDTELCSFLTRNRVVLYTTPVTTMKNLAVTWWRIFSILRREKPDIVHTHLFYANLAGLPMAWLLRVPKRIHTRHHASIHHRYFPKSVVIDKLINRLSTDIVVMSGSLKTIVEEWEKTPAHKLHLIPHGFDLRYFERVDPSAVNALRGRYKLFPGQGPVVGVIARYTRWKGIQFTIAAFRSLLQQFPHAHLILANAGGDYEQEIRLLLQSLPEGSYTEIAFEPDVASLYQLFDIFVHVPVDLYCEAFGQTYVEALAARVPAVFTLSGIAADFIVHCENAMVVDFENAGAIAESIVRILSERALKERLINGGHKSVEKLFGLPLMIERLENLYTDRS